MKLLKRFDNFVGWNNHPHENNAIVIFKNRNKLTLQVSSYTVELGVYPKDCKVGYHFTNRQIDELIATLVDFRISQEKANAKAKKATAAKEECKIPF